MHSLFISVLLSVVSYILHFDIGIRYLIGISQLYAAVFAFGASVEQGRMQSIGVAAHEEEWGLGLAKLDHAHIRLTPSSYAAARTPNHYDGSQDSCKLAEKLRWPRPHQRDVRAHPCLSVYLPPIMLKNHQSILEMLLGAELLNLRPS